MSAALTEDLHSASHPGHADVVADLTRGRKRRRRRRELVIGGLATAVALLFVASLMVGQTFYSLSEVTRVLLGEQVAGASFTVGELRLPRTVMGLLAGLAFGMAGVTFQTMLRNPLASPDVIGISTGASVAAVFGILVLRLGETLVSAFAILAALLVALTIYLLSYVNGVAGARLILIGIGVQAMLTSVISYLLLQAAAWDLQVAMRWLAGSTNGATWPEVVPLMVAFLLLAPVLISCTRGLGLLQLGDDTARALGLRVEATKVAVIVVAVALIAFATASAGPIAFVAFLSGPIAARLCGRAGGPLMVPAGLVGAALVLAADLIGQYAFDNRYPVGVITGALGAPFLIYLLIRANRSGESL